MKGGWRRAGALLMAGLVWTTGCTSSGGNDDSERGNPGMDNPAPLDPGVVDPPDQQPQQPQPPPQQPPPQQPPPPKPPPQQPPPQEPPPQPPPPQEPPPPPVVIPPPTTEGWTFFGMNEGGPAKVYGVTADEGGNIWVAGGEEGLYLLKSGATAFKRFTMADGLRPYGYMPDGSTPPGPKYLKVISVAGGPAGTVFVGYEGLPGTGSEHCESNWDGPSPDPARYKSGDADKVMLLSDDTIHVVHYDIFSGPGVVRDEMRGREKLCNVLRIAWDKRTHSVWFGGNHGFARGDSRFEGNPACNGQHSCAGLSEHAHPAINAYVYSHAAEDKKTWPNDPSKWRVRGALLTDAYYGVAVDPSGDAWFGGADRSTRFRYVSSTGSFENPNFWRAQAMTENSEYAWNRYDIWRDTVGEPTMSRPEQRNPDFVSSMAVAGDGTVWVGSFARGLTQMTTEGQVLRQLSTELVDRKGYVSAVVADPLDGSIWAGGSWGGGLSRVKDNTITHYDYSVFGLDLSMSRVPDIQVDTSGSKRRLLVAFLGYERSDKRWVAGSIGIFTGD
jgi:hypothetical protein